MSISATLSRGRGPMLEFMPDPDAGALAEMIVAFANGVGGTIVLGMDEQGHVRDSAEDLEPLLARALQMCEPPFRAAELPEWHLEETPRGTVTTLVVKPTPYELSVQGRDVFVRSGSINIRLSPEQRNHSRTLTVFEDDVVPGASESDLDRAIIEEYQENRIKRGPRGESFTRAELLRDAGAVDPNGRPTIAGLLLFGSHPHHFFPQVGVVVIRFKGTSIREAAASGERYSRRVEIVGPAARIVERTWEVLFEEIHQQSYLDGLERRERYAYPLEAVREAVVNAICHRDYTITGQRIEIRLFDDRMEIISPGGLPGHITLENILDEHYSRNPRLVRGLYYWGYIEELGQGVDIIYDAMRREHHPPPEFRDTGRSVSVTLRSAIDQFELEYGDQLNPRQLSALRFLAGHERITNRDYRDLCPDVTPETLRLDLRDLVEKGILLKIGDKRGTYYVLK
ncbi:MAG: ATP-binding protein [Anaerolineae bacterium]|jgi:ATP-dependent DNA helicase RecG